MVRILAVIAALGIALASNRAAATPEINAGNELWLFPGQSGWGLNVFHQGDTVFASLFIYGQDNQPRWYTGSDLRNVGNSTYSGALYESSGPWFGGPFDPASVTRRRVGSITIEIRHDTAVLTYDTYEIGGPILRRELVPFTFGRSDLSGIYTGFQTQPGTADEVGVAISHTDSSFTMLTQGAALGSCTYTGTPVSHGQVVDVSGTYACNSGARGSFTMLDVDVTTYGFTSRFANGRINDIANGHMSATRTQFSGGAGVGARTDLWWNPAESGWGLNLVEQGNTLFGTLFVYDPSGRPKWYSASSLVSDGFNHVWNGLLVESTGPWFATTWFPSMVTRRAVGTMRIEERGPNLLQVEYNVDGVSVTKLVNRMTFRTNDLAGSYVGHVSVLPPNTVMDGIPTGATSFRITSGAGGTTIQTHAFAGDCTMAGSADASRQWGQQVAVIGTYACTTGKSGRFFLTDVEVTYSGFTGAFAADGFGVANIAGTRTGGP